MRGRRALARFRREANIGGAAAVLALDCCLRYHKAIAEFMTYALAKGIADRIVETLYGPGGPKAPAAPGVFDTVKALGGKPIRPTYAVVQYLSRKAQAAGPCDRCGRSPAPHQIEEEGRKARLCLRCFDAWQDVRLAMALAKWITPRGAGCSIRMPSGRLHRVKEAGCG